MIEVNGFGWGARIRGGGGGDVGEEFVVVGRQGELMELSRWEVAHAGGDG